MSDELDRSLDELRQAIDRVQRGEGDRAELARILAAVEAKLDDPDDEAHHENLVDRLREGVREFEASHPDLTEVIDRVMHTLSSSGI